VTTKTKCKSCDGKNRRHLTPKTSLVSLRGQPRLVDHSRRPMGKYDMQGGQTCSDLALAIRSATLETSVKTVSRSNSLKSTVRNTGFGSS
jgi:hypothetical protein